MSHTYSISIAGMHCIGCKNLITLTLQDEGFENVVVDESFNTARFTSVSDVAQVREKLDNAFASLSDYSYSGLTTN